MSTTPPASRWLAVPSRDGEPPLFVETAGGTAVVVAEPAARHALAAATERGHTELEDLVSALQDRPGAFAVVVTGADASVTAVVRGDLEIVSRGAGGERMLDGRAVAPWSIARFSRVAELVVAPVGCGRGAGGGADATAVGGRPDGAVAALILEFAGERMRAATADSSSDFDTLVTAPGGTGPMPVPRRSIPAPAFVRIAGGAATRLDRGVVVGRNPRQPRVPSDQPPTLVTVRSPRKLVSATHLRLVQTGASVVATDLRSTNGTVVRAPGRPPLRLRQGESTVVPTGALIDIGDGNIVEILGQEQLDPASDGSGERGGTT